MESLKDSSLKQHIENKASLSKQEDSKISGNDFIIPQIRGQRKENTEIWLDECLLYDPWTSFPISHSLNLRQFSSLDIFEGISPIDIASVSPFGLIHYKKYYFKNQTNLGVSFGKPYGKSFWALIERKKIIKTNIDFGIFTNIHQTKGAYRYYSDEGTPFNPKKSKILTLKNNKQESLLISPYLSLKTGILIFNYYSSIFQEKRELPTFTANKYKKNISNLTFLNQIKIKINLEKKVKSFAIPNTLKLMINHQKGHSKYNTLDKETQNKTESVRLSINNLWKKKYLELNSSLSYGVLSVANINLKEKYQPRKNYFEIYTGCKFKLISNFFFQSKYVFRYSHNNIYSENKSSHKKSSHNYALVLFYKKNKKNIYLQFSESKRLPNLLEELGNGNQIKPSFNLLGEKNIHLELGGFYKNTNSFSANIFCDFTDNKIIFFPSSFNTFKAQNINKSRTLGLEISHSYNHNRLNLYSGLNLMENLDVSNQSKYYRVPHSPSYVAVNQLELLLLKYFICFSNRLTGSYYNDIANTLKVKPHIVSNISFGKTQEFKRITLLAKINLNNIFNIQALTIETVGRKKRIGKIARNEVYGNPLPGRTWTLDLEIKF